MGCDFLFNLFIIYIYIYFLNFFPLLEERTLCSAKRENKRARMVETALASHAAFAVDCMETRGGKKMKKFGDSWHSFFPFCVPPRHAHTPASSVLAAFGSQRLCFLAHRGKGQHYKSRFN